MKKNKFINQKDKYGKYEVNERWRWQIFKVCVILTIIVSAAEFSIFYMNKAAQLLFIPEPLFILRFWILPTIINVCADLIVMKILQSARLKEKSKNIAICVLVWEICACTEVVHYVYGPLLSVTIISIFVTILFADVEITRHITVLSFFSLLLAAWISSVELRANDEQLIFDVIIAGILSFSTYLVAKEIVKHEKEREQEIHDNYLEKIELLQQTKIDTLTGLLNRKMLIEEMDALVEHYDHKTAIQAAIIDIDNFKSINDTYGHVNGDVVLVELANVLKNNIGDGNAISVYRYGGEEFVLLFRDFSSQMSYGILDSCRRAFARRNYEFIKDGRVITFSGGIADYEEVAGTSSDWLEKADQALYQAKSEGKNKLCTYKKPISMY
ncbi:MAG: GGDEF domain-containing protein [Clostridia bacterium]|nr:GGDEF domain-containing protein [Clostridia bacterium]